MSKYIGLCCKTCGVQTDHWINHGEKQLKEYLWVRNLIEKSGVQLQFVMMSIEGFSWAMGEIDKFLFDHKDHEIALSSEYGDVIEIEPEETP